MTIAENGAAEALKWIESSVAVRELEERAVISVEGDDAHAWIQGQITNQCEGAGPGQAVYAFILTLKGRVLADVWALFDEDRVWLDVPAAQVDAVLERLDKYIIMEDVELESKPATRVLSAEGPNAGELHGGWRVDRLGRGGRAWLVGEEDAPRELARIVGEAEARGGGRIDDEAWALAHLARRRPRFGIDFGEHTYPQETGLTEWAVSFNKGCYIGQETVVMLQNRGTPPKVLWHWVIEADVAPAPKTPIIQGEARIGEVTSAARLAAGRVEAFGFVHRGADPTKGASTIGGACVSAMAPVADGPPLV